MEHLRAGQLAFNELYRVDPVVADQIRGTEDDPFYDDERIAHFESKVAELRSAGITRTDEEAR
jgi:hypothetical protein